MTRVSCQLDDDGRAREPDGRRVRGPVTADLDLELALDKVYTELADVFADRRRSLFGTLAK